MTTHAPFKLDTDAYLADTGHLTNPEHGAYLLLLISMWRAKDGWLPGDDRYLARASRMTLPAWRKAAPTMRALLIEKDGKVSQNRIQKDKAWRACHNTGHNSSAAAKSLANNKPATLTAPKPGNDAYKDSLFDSESQKEKSLPSKKDSERVTVEGSRRKPRHPMPANWYPSEKDRAYAFAAGFGHGEVERMASACRNYHQAKGTMIADLPATWRTWVDRAAQFAHRDNQRNGGANGSKRGSIVDAWDKLSRLVEASENSEGGETFGQLLPLGPVRRP